jgi:hypothetical protein
MTPTPLGIAQNHCANWDGGLCTGIDFRADGSMFRFRPEGRRCLLSSHERCSYFETAVLPIGASKEWQQKYPREAAQFEEGAHFYRVHFGMPGPAPVGRNCSDCGVQIGPRQRYCAQCRQKHRKATKTMSQRKWREKDGTV